MLRLLRRRLKELRLRRQLRVNCGWVSFKSLNEKEADGLLFYYLIELVLSDQAINHVADGIDVGAG